MYLYMFYRMLLAAEELRILLLAAALLIFLEVWVLRSAYGRSNALLTLSIYLCHGLNFLLFLPLYTGYLFAKSDTSEDSGLPRVEINLRNGDILRNMIVLRGMERGVLSWNGKGSNVLTVGEYQLYERGDQRLVRLFGKEIGVEDTSLSVDEGR